jgi:peptide chain release factor 2
MQEEQDLAARAELILSRLDLPKRKKKVAEIEKESGNPDFWKDNQAASAKMKELALLQKEIENAEYMQLLLQDHQYDELKTFIHEMEQYLYLSGPYDNHHAILSIHAGQGGVDAMDWAQMLYRMYTRFFERRGWDFESIDEAPGEEAGLKSATLLVKGDHAYGYLKGEQGTHRLVRLSPFNSANLRQTSFALISVLPQLEHADGIEIRDDEIEFEAFRSGGHGGQNVNKVSTAVRIKHIPTGITVTAQTERSQLQNRENAMKLLTAKLWALEQEKQSAAEKEMKGEYKPASWGNQIRSYVLHPYQMVKDLRTKVETSQTDAVLDGDIDLFIEAELKGE